MPTSRALPVAMLSDLPAYGRVALALGIPLLERYGIQTCSLPTALLSTHGAYPGAVCVPQTEFLRRSIEHLRNLDVSFGALYSGFVASSEQYELIAAMAVEQRQRGAFILADPILGDNGKIYGITPPDAPTKMRELVRSADLITPNITEAALLLEKAPGESPAGLLDLKEWAKQLSNLGPRFVVITSTPGNRIDRVGIALYDKFSHGFTVIEHKLIPPNFPGTGDYLAAALLAELIRATTLGAGHIPLRAESVSWRVFEHASKKAAAMVSRALAASRKMSGDPRQGLAKI